MKGKDVLSMATKIQEENELKEKTQKESIEKKSKQSEAFLRCKDRCHCHEKACDALLLKQCPVCKNVQKSRCGKVSCLDKNGERPIMILPAAATAGTSARRSLKSQVIQNPIFQNLKWKKVMRVMMKLKWKMMI